MLDSAPPTPAGSNEKGSYTVLGYTCTCRSVFRHVNGAIRVEHYDSRCTPTTRAPKESHMRIAPTEESRLAKTGEEYLRLVLSDADWIVRSPDDMRQLRGTGEGPLAKLPEDDFRAFVDGLEWKAGGVGGGSYKPLMGSLALTEIYEVFERFGMSRGYALETHDAKCVGSSCETTIFSFCPSSVCEHVVREA